MKILVVPLFMAFSVSAHAQISDGSSVFYRICGDCGGNADSDGDSYFDPETLATISVSIQINMTDGFCAEEVIVPAGGGPTVVGACDPISGCSTTVIRKWNGLPVGSELLPSFWFEMNDEIYHRSGGATPQTDPGSGSGSHTANFGSLLFCGASAELGLSIGDAVATANAVCAPCESSGS